MKAQVENISPAKAQLYLTSNIVNRPLKQGKIQTLVSDIRNGAWELNGEPICFTESGRLCDGQHRLTAILRSGKTVPVLVVRGIKDNVTIFDRGVNRSEADSLYMSGVAKEVANNKTVAIAKLHYRLQTGSRNIPYNFIKDFITENEKELIAINAASNRHTSKSGTGGLSVKSAVISLPAFYAYKCGVNIERIERFFEVLSKGFYDSSQHESAAIVLRNDLINNNIDTQQKIMSQEKAVLIVEKALYDFVNKNDRKVSYRKAGAAIYSNNECFKVDRKYR